MRHECAVRHRSCTHPVSLLPHVVLPVHVDGGLPVVTLDVVMLSLAPAALTLQLLAQVQVRVLKQVLATQNAIALSLNNGQLISFNKCVYQHLKIMMFSRCSRHAVYTDLVMNSDQTNHVIVHLQLLVHGDCQVGFIHSTVQPET